MQGHMTTDKVADELGLHPEYVRQLIRSRRLPATKVGRQWFVPEAEVVKRRDASLSLALEWLREVPRRRQRAAVIAGLMFRTFNLSDDQVAEIMGLWLESPKLGAAAVRVARARG